MTAASSLALLLRAVADERRLRLLRLCADGPASVSALAAALADSEPNVSRQLKQLAEAGLVRRSRQGQFVEYSLAEAPEAAAALAQWLLQRLGSDDAPMRTARAALRRTRGGEASRIGVVRGLAPASRFGRTLAATLEPPARSDARGRRVLLRVRYPELAAVVAAQGAECALLAGSIVERAALRRWAAVRGLECEVDLAAAFLGRAPVQGWDLVVLDDAGARDTGLAALDADLALARRLLAPRGRAWLMAEYEMLERGADDARPLQRLQIRLRAAGFECQELLPVEAEGRHLLVARSQPLTEDPSLARTA